MASENRERDAILSRLEKVEKENRTLKRFALAFLSLIAAVVVMGQARPSRTMEAEQFVLKDPQGLVRARLGVSGRATTLNFYDAAGVLRQSLMVGANGIPGLSLFDAAGNQTVSLANGEAGPSLGLQEGAGRLLSVEQLIKQPGIVLHVAKDEMGLIIEDREGFSAVVGNADLVSLRTGERQQTSVASVVLFDKDKKVLWSAP